MGKLKPEAALPEQEGAAQKEQPKRPDLSVIEGGASAAQEEIRKKQAARMAEITGILDKWRNTPIGEKANAILDRAHAAKEDLDKVLAEMKALLPTREAVDAQAKAAKEAAGQLKVGDTVTWMTGKTVHRGEYAGLTPTGAAKVQEIGKAKVSYVPANFLKVEEILELTEDMVEEEKPVAQGIPEEFLGSSEKTPSKEALPTFEAGEYVTWVDAGKTYFGHFDTLSHTGLAIVGEEQTHRPMYVRPQVLEKVTETELGDDDIEIIEPEIEEKEWDGPEIQPVDPNDLVRRKTPGALPGAQKPGELPAGQTVKGFLTGRVRPPEPPIIDGEIVEPDALPEGQKARGFLPAHEKPEELPGEEKPGELPEGQRVKGYLPEHKEEQGTEGQPNLETLRLNFAERDAELTDKFKGVFGWARRNLVPGQKEKYLKVLETRQQAYQEYSRERALEMKDKLDKMIDEEMKLADAKAAEFVDKRHWGQQLYNWYGNSEFAKKMKVGRLAVGLGLIAGGAVVGPVALAAALGGGLIAWKIMGMPLTGVGAYDTLRMGEEKFLSGLGKMKLDKDNQTEMDAFVADNKLGKVGLLRNKEQRKMYDDKLQEIRFRQVGELDKKTGEPKVSDAELDKMIKWFETTVAMKGVPPSKDPTYRRLMEEKAKRLRGQLEEVDAGEEGNETDRAKFAEAVEARKKEKVDGHVLDVYRVLRMGALAEKAQPGLQFEGLGATAQDFMKSNFNWESFKSADKASQEAVLKKLKRKATEFFHPDKQPEDPDKATETLLQLIQVIDSLGEGKIEPTQNAAIGDKMRDMQTQAVEKLPLSAQTVLQKYEEKYGKGLSGLYKHLFTPGSVALLNVPSEQLGARLEAVQLVKEIEAELRQAMMNDEALIKDAEEEVRGEMETVIAEVGKTKEDIERRNAAALEALAKADDEVNRQMADKAKKRKDLMKVTAVLVAGILASGVIQKILRGGEAGGKPTPHGPPERPPVKPPIPVSDNGGRPRWPVSNDPTPTPRPIYHPPVRPNHIPHIPKPGIPNGPGPEIPPAPPAAEIVEPTAAAKAVERITETQHLKVEADYLKWAWQEMPEPDMAFKTAEEIAKAADKVKWFGQASDLVEEVDKLEY